MMGLEIIGVIIFMAFMMGLLAGWFCGYAQGFETADTTSKKILKSYNKYCHHQKTQKKKSNQNSLKDSHINQATLPTNP
ncbi:hypothetical protein ES708_32413 [subsurface metagenome]